MAKKRKRKQRNKIQDLNFNETPKNDFHVSGKRIPPNILKTVVSEGSSKELYGILNCWDRVIITGSLDPFCYAKGMTGYLYSHNMRPT